MPPRVTGSATGEDLVLTASDGNHLAAYLATPERPAAAAVVLLPDARGLNPFYWEMALRFAETGTTTLAIDFFGRSAGTGPRGEDFDSGPHLKQVRRDEMLRDVAAGVDYLRAHTPWPVLVVGFCLGGGVALHAGTTGMELAGVVGFYAWTGEIGQSPALPNEFAAEIRCPALGLFGDADHAIAVDVPRALDEQMTRARVPHEVVIYPGEPHGFFELHHMGEEGHQAAAADAWERLLIFVGRHAAKTG